MSGSRRDRLDAWLFLPPELEREGRRCSRCSTSRRLPGGTLLARQREVEQLVLAGTPERWRDYLRACGESARTALAGEPSPPVTAAALRLVAMLLEQQLLAPGVPHWQLGDDDERARLESVLRSAGLAIDDV